jgi:AcrR family transcriptional regulator
MSTRETKGRILDAAERLFARRGFAATSLRTIVAEAGVNLAAVHYHFGSKDGLVRAVFGRRFAPVNADRLARLDALQRAAGKEPVAVVELVRALVEPAVRIATCGGDRGATLLRMIGRVHTEPGRGLRDALHAEFDEVAGRYLAAFAAAQPALGEGELGLRFRFSIAAMAAALAEHAEAATPGSFDADDLDRLVNVVVAFAAAGMSAPAAQTPVPAARNSP